MTWYWPFNKEKEDRDGLISISDPLFLEHFGIGGLSQPVSVVSAMSHTAVYRAVGLLSGTIAGLPLKTYMKNGAGDKERVSSIFDDPGFIGDYTMFEWVEELMVSLLLHGNAYLDPQFNGGGQLIGLIPLHPSRVKIEFEKGIKTFKVTLGEGVTKTLGPTELIHIPALKLDGVRGLSPIAAASQAISTGLAGERAANKMFRSPMIGGIVTSKSADVTEAEGKVISESIKNKTAGPDNTGDVVFVNRDLDFKPWTLPAKDAQFLESRQFQVVEIARLFGLPPILLSDSSNTTSWGQGVREVIRGTSKFTLVPWTHRLQSRFSRLVPEGQWVEFDYAGLLEGTQEEVTANLVAQIEAGILTRNEARAILNRPPRPGGDELKIGDSNESV